MTHKNKLNKLSSIARFGLFLLPAFFSFLVVQTWMSHLKQESKQAETTETMKQQILETYSKLPLSFEANLGQTDDKVEFLSRGNGYTLFLTPSEMVLALQLPIESNANFKMNPETVDKLLENSKVTSSEVLRMKLVNANPNPKVIGLEETYSKSNYFIGNDSQEWQTNISNYAKVKYENIYPGVDLIYYGNQKQLEYDFIVAPGVDPNAILLSFEGADDLSLDEEGNLIQHFEEGEVIQ